MSTRSAIHVGFWFSMTLIASTWLYTPYASAQVGLLGIENSLSIRMDPAYPKPGDTVLLTATSPILDVENGNIVWESNGKRLAEGLGANTARITLGKLGSETTVEVTVTTSEGSASGSITVAPSELDLLIDSDAYVPPFFRGRAATTIGTTMHFEAHPYFMRNGVRIPNDQITFTWRKNNSVLANQSGRGRAIAYIPIQHLFGNDTISVEATSIDRSRSSRASFTLSPTQPIVTLYQNHPLLGVLYHRALENISAFTENEISFVAIPYFAQAESAADPSLTYEWRVNGLRIDANEKDPNIITINADNSTGEASLALELTHKTNYFLSAKNAWNITLSSQAFELNSFDPFNP